MAQTARRRWFAQNGMFEYEYDSRGNITSEKRGDLTTTYQYDALGQLIRVNDPHENATWVYNYDRGGNILSKVKYAYTTGTVGTALETIPYVYGDSNWKDKLTSVQWPDDHLRRDWQSAERRDVDVHVAGRPPAEADERGRRKRIVQV